MDKNFNAIEDGIPFEATEFWSTDCVFYNDMIYTTTYESGLVANDLSGKKVDIPIGLTNHYNFNNLSVDATGNLYFRGNELTTGLQAYIKYDLNTNTILYESKVSESRIGFSNAYYNAAVQNIYTANDSGVYRYNADTGEYIGTELTFGVDTSYQISDNLWIVDVLTDNDGNIYMILYDDSGEERLCKIFKYTLAAGDKPEEEDINEIVFTANYIQDYILQAIANYNLRNSEIIIKPDVTYGTRQEMLNSLEQAAANFATRIMANDVGDIVATGGMGLDYYNILHTDAFVDLTDYIRNDKSYADLNHSALASLTFDGKLNGLPVGLVLYNYLDFNTQLNDELQLGLNPHSLKWSELLNAAKSLETGRENLMLYGSSDIDVLLSEILITNMPNLIDLEAKTYDLKQDWFIKLINGLKEVRDLDNLTSNSTSTPFLFRQIASPGLIAPYSYRWDVETVPAVSGEVNRNNLMYTNHLYSISARSQNKDAAWEFLSFLIEEDQMTMDSLGGVPLNNKALDKLLASFDEDRQIFYREITGNIDILYDFGLYKEDIVTPVMEFINDNITLDEALEDAEYNIWLRMNE
jgi:ABC-type glycerol-3-phosphate transport system substrate-binding protein